MKVLFLLFALGAGAAYAHSPHDVIDAVAATATDEGEALAWALVSGDLVMRSDDLGKSWSTVTRGLDNRHAFTDVAVAAGPARALVAVATDGDGLYASLDRGQTWRSISRSLEEQRFQRVWVLDAGGRLLAASCTGALYETRDLGEQWTRLPIDGHVTAAAQLPDLAEALLVGTRDGHIFVGSGQGGLVPATVPSGMGAVTAFAGSGRAIVAGTAGGGILRSRDGGRSFRPAAAGPADTSIQALAGPAGETHALMAVTARHGAFLSEDGGETWEPAAAGLTTDEQADDPLHRSPHFIDVAVVEPAAGASTWLVAGFDGLFRSEDRGASWQEAQTLLPGRIMTMRASPPTRDGHCLALASYGGGAYRWCTGSGSWEILNQGLGVTRLEGLAFSPSYANDGVLLSGAPAQLLVHRPGSDTPWQAHPIARGWWDELLSRGAGILHYRLGLPRWMTTDLLDVNQRQRPFPVDIEVGPEFSSTRKVYVTTRRHGLLAVSLDEGSSEVLRESDTLLGQVMLSPDYTVDRTLVMAARQEGILVSRDGGDSWQSANTGLTFLERWRQESGQPGREYDAERSAAFQIPLAMATDGEDAVLFAATSAGLYRAALRTLAWDEIGAGLPDEPYVLAVAASPTFETDGLVIVSIKGHGLFLSRDRGASFQSVGADDVADAWIRHLSVSPGFQSDGTLYAASEDAVFRSRDGGERWHIMERPVRYEGTRGVVQLEGEWRQRDGRAWSGTSAWATRSKDARLHFRFVGTGVDVRGDPGNEPGRVSLTVDGKPVALSPPRGGSGGQAFATIRGLPCQAHDLELSYSPATDGDAEVIVDAIDVHAGSCNP